MDRDASPFLVAPLSPADAVPPSSPQSVRLTALVGVGLTAAAAILALVSLAIGSSPAVLNTARLFLSFIGVITAGAALSMRPDIWWAWALASLTAALGVIGLPADWDSFHVLFRALAGVSAAGAVVCVASIPMRVLIASGAIFFHFMGIFLSATSPPPRPWINEQVYIRVFNPYLQFLYLRNAYQYYSPEPGPSSLVAFFIKTETGTDSEGRKQYTTKWIVMPRRPADVRDPMALTYYRRLSLTEQLARGSLGLTVPTDQFEKTEVWQRRFIRSKPLSDHSDLIPIPYHPTELQGTQYQLPNSEVTRFTLPSYASHIILENTSDKEAAGKTTVKVYRLQHQTLSVEQFLPVGALKKQMPAGATVIPYHPSTYRPYFLGEFDALGNLIDPQEPFLYWLLPILTRYPAPGSPVTKTYIDYLSVHALGMTPEEVLNADESQGKVFNWSQLR